MTSLSSVLDLRRECLIHRYLYYVLAESLISDYEYDMLEKKLMQAVENSPEEPELLEFCPSSTVGSDIADDYPIEIRNTAESRLRGR